MLVLSEYTAKFGIIGISSEMELMAKIALTESLLFLPNPREVMSCYLRLFET